MEPLISVIVPIYNVEPYLRKCVDSILNQTYNNLEIILVDDGSPDGCPGICDEYAEKDSRVKVIHKENGGLSDARNVGMAQSYGSFLSFVDSDDVLPENAIEVLLNTANTENADLVIGGHKRFTDELPALVCEDITVQRMTNAEAMADMLRNGCASWARLYRRELHLPIRFPVGEINEDEAIVLRLLDRCNCVAKTSALVYYYRCRPESITTVGFSEKKLAWVKHCKDNLEFIREKYPELVMDAAVRYRRSLVWALREIALSEKRYYVEQERLKFLLQEFSGHFLQAPYKSRGERIRYILMRYLPFEINKWLLRFWNKKGGGLSDQRLRKSGTASGAAGGDEGYR